MAVFPNFLGFWDFPIAIFGKLDYNVVESGKEWGKVGISPLSPDFGFGVWWSSIHMFLGQAEYSLDDKGRVIIPSRYRETLGERVIVTRSLDPCITLYPMDVWMELAQKVNALPMTSVAGRALRRLLFADAADVTSDRQGRILLPDRLREHAGLELSSAVLVVGLDRYIEFWNPERWAEQNARELAMLEDDPALWEKLQI